MFETEDNKQEYASKKYYGKYPGVVLSNDPPQNDSHRGELLVEVHGILEETPDGESQRPIQVKAKPCFPPGFFFIPEEKDNVWVEFGAGDINNPIWTGVWYPKGKTPDTVGDEAPTKFQKIIRTVSGQVIQLDDSDNAERIVILHKSGSTVEIAADGKVTIIDKGNDMSIVSEKINLGTKGGAQEHLVLGETLKSKLEELIQIVTRHVHPTGVGPSGPPATEAASLNNVLLSLSQILSKQNTTD